MLILKGRATFIKSYLIYWIKKNTTACASREGNKTRWCWMILNQLNSHNNVSFFNSLFPFFSFLSFFLFSLFLPSFLSFLLSFSCFFFFSFFPSSLQSTFIPFFLSFFLFSCFLSFSSSPFLQYYSECSSHWMQNI